jgi:hypothetical protein
MHRQLLLTAFTCLCAAGCAKNSAVVAGDPFLSPNQSASKVAVAETAAPPKQTVSLDEHRINQANFEEPAGIATTGARPTFAEQNVPMEQTAVAESSLAPPDKSEWWKTQPGASQPATDGIKVPAQSSANGRVGTVSMSYGMGQMSKP